jgi:hypothetical protein
MNSKSPGTPSWRLRVGAGACCRCVGQQVVQVATSRVPARPRWPSLGRLQPCGTACKTRRAFAKGSTSGVAARCRVSSARLPAAVSRLRAAPSLCVPLRPPQRPETMQMQGLGVLTTIKSFSDTSRAARCPGSSPRAHLHHSTPQGRALRVLLSRLGEELVQGLDTKAWEAICALVVPVHSGTAVAGLAQGR